MDDFVLPAVTVRALDALLRHVLARLRSRALRFVRGSLPFVEPPPDLGVQSRLGIRYTGVLLLDRGEVLGGIVIAIDVRASSAAAPPSPAKPPFVSYASGFDEPRSSTPARASSGLLPGWAEDPRDRDDLDDPPPWERR